MKKVLRWLGFFFLILNCSSVFKKLQHNYITAFSFSPETIPYVSIANLRFLNSFKYYYIFQSDLPHNVKGNFTGTVILPNIEERKGILIINNRPVNIFVKACGNFQYISDGSRKGWQRGPRSDENDILAIIERVAAHTKFYLMSKEALESYSYTKGLEIKYNENKYFYSFWPYLPLLDPTFNRKFKALLIINKKTLLPEEICAIDSTKVVKFRIKLWAFNKPYKINIPFIPEITVELRAKFSQEKVDYYECKKIISERLKALPINFRIEVFPKIFKKQGIKIFLEDSEYSELPIIKALLTSRGMFYAVKDNVLSSSETLFFSQKDIESMADENLGHQTKIRIELSDNGRYKLENFLASDSISSLHWYWDSMYIGVTVIDKRDFLNKIDILGKMNTMELRIISAVIKNEMLPSILDIIAVQRVKSDR
jgi:hypothetical protein